MHRPHAQVAGPKRYELEGGKADSRLPDSSDTTGRLQILRACLVQSDEVHLSVFELSAMGAVSLPLDRVVAAGVEWEWKGLKIHNNLTCADLGDGDVDQDNDLAGRVKGSFDTNYTLVRDTQIVIHF